MSSKVIQKARIVHSSTCAAFHYEHVEGECWLKTRGLWVPSVVPGTDGLDTIIYERKTKHGFYSKIAGKAIYGFNVLGSKADQTVEECQELCNQDSRCITASYEISSAICYKKYLGATWDWTDDGNFNSYTLLRGRDGPCPTGVRYRDLCLERSYTNGVSVDDAKAFCSYIGGQMVRPFDYKKWAFTNMAGVWYGTWRIDLDSVGHNGTWKTETDKIYPEMWQWDEDWSGPNGPFDDGSCTYGLLFAGNRVQNRNHYGGKLGCDDGTSTDGEVICEIRK